MNLKTYVTGFPRIGEHRELKKALENFWSKNFEESELQETARELRKKHWLFQKESGVDCISSNDFSFYDSMLDTIVMLGAIPKRFVGIENATARYFAMARGNDDVTAMAMVKWFNTNYHYIVPELDKDIKFALNTEKIISEYKEAKALGLQTKINVIGPITFLTLAKTMDEKSAYDYFDELLAVYKELLQKLSALDETVFVQMDEPIFVADPSTEQLELLKKAYGELTKVTANVKIIFTTYFEHANEAVEALSDIPVWGIALDFVHGAKNLESLKNIKDKKLIAGVVDGRNIWINDYQKSLDLLKKIEQTVNKDQIIVSTSCSLLHSPYTTANEPESTVKKWLAFAHEKVQEVIFLSQVFFAQELSAEQQNALQENKKAIEEKSSSDFVYNAQVRERIKNEEKKEREGTFQERIALQDEILQLPKLPSTTIGSFPQTPELRKIRRDFKNKKVSLEEYENFIHKYIDDCIAFQEEAGLDVLVHGEPERNDMVEYFGELLEGFHFTKKGWVQSYGSRCVKPPIVFGDVIRKAPMTIEWIKYAQSKTKKFVKGMLTGPVTILNWSFVRNDLPRSAVAEQIALALKDEIQDLQDNGIRVIQVDEAAFKEGYPLRKENIGDYENWAVRCFKLALSSAKKETQMHTHMCYSEFNDIMPTIQAMDADVITIETARGGNKLLDAFKKVAYENEIGPGVYDIHSPRVPSVDEFKEQIANRLEVLDLKQTWINPDCGLKTRKWEEVKPALQNMVQAIEALRETL